MKFIKIENSVLSENTYLVYDENTLRGFLIDTGSDRERIEEAVKKSSVRVEGILLTHGHFDHALSAKYFQDTGIPVYIHEKDADKLPSHKYDMSRFFGAKYDTFSADVFIEEGELALAGIPFRVIHTPGHSAGGVCYYFEEDGVVFTGDTLFSEDIGRSDFKDGSFETLKASIVDKLFVLPDSVKVCPGHEEDTTIGKEKNNKDLFRQ
ncbi:MAG: MBL fold metallo-hydrolase [Clostridiales bacterium]|jgi:glyoxylase-like metal-dependent hydrolase (beta-lactamase superfamily II)|nr:MBL fold metallo-hydrolase [Clostridiales bacterium]